MELIVFKFAVVSRTPEGDLLLALMNGARSDAAPGTCVALLQCRPEVARAMCSAVGSAMKAEQ